MFLTESHGQICTAHGSRVTIAIRLPSGSNERVSIGNFRLPSVLPSEVSQRGLSLVSGLHT